MLTENKELRTIDLSVTDKEKFRINGSDRILELNTSDMGIVDRFNEVRHKLNALAEDATELKADEIVAESDIEDGSIEISDSELKAIGKKIVNIDKQLRDYVDYIFDSNVSETCAPNGTMFDMFNGKYRYEHILEKLIMLYVDKVRDEYRKAARRMETHTAKYTKKTTKKK